MATHILKGSERQPVKGARSLGKADPLERLEVSILLRRRAVEPLRKRLSDLQRPSQRKEHLEREDFAEQFGADPEDFEAVRKFASSHGLAVVQESVPRRTMVLAGTVAQFNKAFRVELAKFEHEGG